jgi:hypothetical protein
MPSKSQWWFLARVSAVVAVIAAAKLLAHAVSGEVISLNALFSGIIAANVFLMGFLLSGVLSDYKESERLPGELSACLENMAQEIRGIGLGKGEPDVRPCLGSIAGLAHALHDYFYKRAEIESVLGHVDRLTDEFAILEPQTQATFIARVKQEQSNLRRSIVRIDTIRETSFISSGYLLADLITFLLCGGLVLVNMDPFYESLSFAIVISFLLIFLLQLIRDLDNPFGYYERYSGADVTLKPFEDTIARLDKWAALDEALPPVE